MKKKPKSKQLIPPLASEELAQIESSILAEGGEAVWVASNEKWTIDFDIRHDSSKPFPTAAIIQRDPREITGEESKELIITWHDCPESHLGFWSAISLGDGKTVRLYRFA
jgi:hypothetical protein